VSEVLAGAAAGTVTGECEVTGALATPLRVADVAPVDAAAVLVRTQSGPLDVLAATSHLSPTSRVNRSAFDALLELAATEHVTLAAAASRVMERAGLGTLA
jgi:hypothetical protein